MTVDTATPGRLDLEAVVEDRVRVAEDVVAVTLRAGVTVPDWSPGAHVDIELPGGLIRQYSLCGDPRDGERLRIAVLLEEEGRGGSIAVHALEPGARVRIRGIRNHFPLVEASEYVFIAGGIGVTPLLPMIEHVERAGSPWVLHYSGRSVASMAYAEVLSERFGSRVQLHPSDAGARADIEEIVSAASAGAAMYCCGPQRLMDQFEVVCAQQGRSGHLERFAATPDLVADAVRPEDDVIDVHLERTGVTISVPPGQSILAAAEEAGGDVFGSCEEGICGTCETRVLDGTPDHRDSVLCGQDTGTMMICVSRALTRRLVIDA